MDRFDISTVKLIAVMALLYSVPAHAQRTDENAVTVAEDAFGTVVGHESIGIYDDGNVRGFSPQIAGNLRIEGLYFDQQGGLSGRINDGETIKVGVSSQGYLFPAPTGVVDMTLRGSGNKLVLSPLVSTDSYGSFGFEFDAQLPLTANQLSTAVGFGVYHNEYGNGGSSKRWNFGLVPRWHAPNGLEVIAFYSREQTNGDTSQGQYIPTDNFLPSRIVRQVYPGPLFAVSDYYSQNIGLITKARFNGWDLRAGLFQSTYNSGVSYSNDVSVSPDMSTERNVIAYPNSNNASLSGELQVSRRWVDGPRQFLIALDAHGRDSLDLYGNGESVDLGKAGLNQVIRASKPDFTFGRLTEDRTHQLNLGVAYDFNWKGLGELTLGVQHTRYSKAISVPAGLNSGKLTETWMPSISVAAPLSKGWSAYASYVRGLEDSGSAPGYAINGGQILPATRTQQYDFGVRWSKVENTSLIIGFYDITKPYYDLSVGKIYDALGTVESKGIEASLTSTPFKGLTIVTGGSFSRPRVSGSSMISEPVGARPIGKPDVKIQMNVNYQLPFARNIVFDAYVNHESSVAGTVDNAIIIPGSTRFGGGLRYNFKINKIPYEIRLSGFNLGDTYRLTPIGSGVYVYNNATNFAAYLSADF